MLVCIAADGTSLTPMVIVQRSTAELELFEVGYTPNQRKFADRENGFIDGGYLALNCLFPVFKKSSRGMGEHPSPFRYCPFQHTLTAGFTAAVLVSYRLRTS
jgi:hypothetical protein